VTYSVLDTQVYVSMTTQLLAKDHYHNNKYSDYIICFRTC